MTPPPLRSRESLSPFQVVLIVLVLGVVAGGSLLLSVPETTQLMEGAIEWHEESILRSVVRLLCLNYEFPTHYPDTVKGYLLGLGAGLALLASAVHIWRRRPEENRPLSSEEAGVFALDLGAVRAAAARPIDRAPGATLGSPLKTTPVLLALFLLWSFASSRWSTASDLSLGASLQVALQWLWAFVLGATLQPRGIRLIGRWMIAVSGAVAAIAIWYYYARNPGLRAMFPYGNPTFLSACLLPGVFLCVAAAFESLRPIPSPRPSNRWLGRMAMVLVGGACVWAFVLARSRGALVGLVFGLLAFGYFALRGRWRWAPALVGLGCAVGGVFYAGRVATTESPTGRDATVRFRVYAASYAWDLFRTRPLTGLGQGGFVLHGDALAVNDVLDDPSVFENRIEHAHNEWLETLCDLGSVGFVLLMTLLARTLAEGDKALAPRSLGSSSGFRRPLADPDATAARWRRIGLLAALTALVVEETFGVGLRVPGVATWFFTIIGLLWAESRDDSASLVTAASASPARRATSGAIGTGVAVVVLVLVQADWSASRNAFGAETALRAGRFDDATRLAAAATNAMNPQRALANLHRLAEIELAIARERQSQGMDRARRALSADPFDRRLLELGLVDLRAADEACKLGNHALKELILRCPRFIHQGATEYRLNLVQAQLADGYEQIRARVPAGPLRDAIPPVDAAEAARFVDNAAKALQRELWRQPFDPELALAFARTAGPATSAQDVVEVLARPLRVHTVTQAYAQTLAELLEQPAFGAAFASIREEAQAALRGAPPTDAAGRPVERWAPEKLRLSAAVAFLAGDFEAARRDLSVAAEGYDRLRRPSPMGAAAAWAELADAIFFLHPGDLAKVAAPANRAIAIAPQSGPGRAFVRAVHGRLVDYALAAGQEERAAETLRSMTGWTEASAVSAELDARARRLAETFVRRAESGETGWLSPALARRMAEWIRGWRGGSADDPEMRFLAARWALVQEHGPEAAAELGHAVAAGLPPEVAKDFLDHAVTVLPDDPSLRAALNSLATAPPNGEPGP